MAIIHFFTKSQPQTDYEIINSTLLEQPSDIAQASFVVDDIIKDILSLAGFVCNLPINYQKGSGKLLKSIDELSMITAHLTHIAKISKSISKLKSPLSFTAQREFDELWERISLILRTLEDAFLKSNSITTMWMLRQHAIVQEHIKDAKKNHIKRLRNGTCNVETGMFFLDLLHDCEQISLHCTALFQEAYIMNYLEERKG